MTQSPVLFSSPENLLSAFRAADTDPRRTVVIVGAGIYGSVMAERFASVLNRNVLVLDRRNHLGGNAAAFRDPETGIEIHRYGSHIFHTKSDVVHRYLSRFTDWNAYRHKVLTTRQNRVFAMPISLMTINAFFGLNLKPGDVEPFIRRSINRSISKEPVNLEEKAISLIGEELYRAFIEGYTTKQWGRSPRLLPPEIITRLPVRDNYNIDYFDDPHQGIPLDGYDRLFERLLTHPHIRVFLNVDYIDVKEAIPEGAFVIYTGMIDRLFDNRFGPLEWRGLRFETETLEIRDSQGTSVMNYADAEIPFTRIHEFKHYHPEWTEVFRSERTVICREYPSAWQPGEEAYYPINDAQNQALYRRYAEEASKQKNLFVGGRLGAYRYWDMDKAVENALETFETNFLKKENEA